MKLNTFFKQCSEKGVFKMLSIYVVSSWVVLQVLSVTSSPLGLPEKSITFLIIFLLICFPLYIFLLWKFQFSRIEIKDTDPQVEANDSEGEFQDRKAPFRKLYYAGLGIISIVCFIAVFLIINKNFGNEQTLAAITSKEVNDKIAVLKFGNNTGDIQYDIVSKMASDWIIHGITENQVGQVITQDLIDEYQSILKEKDIQENENTIVQNYLKPGKIISGNFYKKDGKLLFRAMLVDGKTNKTVISFKPTSCNSENPLDCIDNLNQSIIGYFITEDKQNLMLQQDPPKYGAYKAVLEAKYSEDNDEYQELLLRAITIDSMYFEPKVLLVGHYYNLRQYKRADSLLQSIKPDSYTNKRQLNLLNMYDASLKGDNRTIYNAILNEYELAPNDLKTNKTAMVIALQYVNRPQDVEAIYNTINMDTLGLQNCKDCITRLYLKAYADIELENYDLAITNIKDVQKDNKAPSLNKPLAIAYSRARKYKDLNLFLDKLELTNSLEYMQDLYLQTGKEFLLQKDTINATTYFTKIVEADRTASSNIKLANALFFLGDYSKAANIFKVVLKENPEDLDALSKLAISYYKLGNDFKASQYHTRIEGLNEAYQYGKIEYALAQYDAAIANEEDMYDHLMKAAASGALYYYKTFKNDPLFLDYSSSNEFQKALTFWE